MTEQASLSNISETSTKDQNSEADGFKETSLGKIPAEWEVKNLGEDFEINYGNGKKEDEFVEDGNYPVYGANGIIGRSDDYIYENPVVTVTCRGATCGNVNLTKPKSWVTNNSLVLENGNENNPIFLAEALRQHSVDRAITGSAQPQITSTLLSKMDYLKVPLPEQRRIASVLYNVDQAINKTEEIIEQTQRVKKGLMQNLFTEGYFEHETRKVRLDAKEFEIAEDWEIVSVGDVTQRTHQGINTSADDVEYVDAGIPILQAEHITGGYFDFDDARRISSEDYDEYSEKYQPEEGDSLVCNIGTIGENIFVDSTEDFVIAWNLFLIKPDKDEIDPFYLNQALDWLKMTRRYHPLTSGSTTQFVNKTNMESLTFPLPDPDEQKKIAELLSQYDKRLGKLQQEKEQLQRLKKGLMQDLLTGSVRTGEDVRVLDEVVEVEG